MREQLQKKVGDYKLALHRKAEILDKAPKQKTYIESKLKVIDDEIKVQENKGLILNGE